MKLFYGWRMVAASGGIQFLQAGLLLQAFGAYVAVLTEELGWSKTALAGGAALLSLEGALLGPALGWVIDRFGPQMMIRIGIVMFGAGLMLLGQVDTLGGFYFAFGVIAVGISLSGYFPLTVALVQWFVLRRARALSAMGMGLALGGASVPAVAWAMQVFGWRATAFASGVLVIVLGWPLAMVIRRRPELYGEHPDGLPPRPVAEGGAPPAGAPRAFTARQALRTPAFWQLALGHACALLVVMAVNVHAITHMKEGLGYSIAQASWVITLMTVAQVGGVLLGYLIGDRYDKRRIVACCMLGHGLGLLLLTYAAGMTGLVAFSVVHGLAWGLRGPLMQAIRADYFGLEAIGMILGLSAMIIAIGQVGGPMIAGAFADATGDYRLGFTVLALLAGAGSWLFFSAKRP